MPGTGSVYRVTLTRPDGTKVRRWVAQTSVGPRHGRKVRRRYAPRADNTRRGAQAVLEAMLAEEGPASPSMTAGSFLLGWIDRYVQRPKVGASQAANTRGIVTHHLLPVLADVRLIDVVPSTVEAVIARTAAARSPSTVRHVYDVLSVAFSDAERDGLIPSNPVRRVDRPSVPRTDRRPWTKEECIRFLDACRGDRYEALYILVAATGIRQGEALGLAWDDVDLDNAKAYISLQLQRRDGRYVRVPLKSDGRPHAIDLPSIAVDALRVHRAAQDVRPVGGGLLFVTAAGRPVSGSVVTHQLQRIAEAAGLPRRDFHGLRHSLASLHARLGIAPKVTQAALGHSDVSTTMSRYTHTDDEMGRAAAALVDEALRRVG